MNKSRFIPKKPKAVFDEHLLRREIYNPNNFDIIFTRNIDQDLYIMRAGIPLGEIRMVCKSKDFLILPHGYFIATGDGLPKGELINAIVNLGDTIGKGNKLPSPPIAETRKYY